MEAQRAAEIIRALADGCDPVTGESFPPGSPYQQAETVRALFMALEALERRGRSRSDRPGLAGRSPEGRRPLDPNRPKIGANWTPEAEQQLRDGFAAHKPIPELATACLRAARTGRRTVGRSAQSRPAW
jgi:hypothetical protein